MNQYRCETCTRRDQKGYGWCRYANAHVNPPNCVSAIAEFTSRCGCTYQSDFQSERDKVMDEFVLITKHEYRLLEWVFGKLDEGRYSDALAEIITGVEQREELRQAGERG